MKAEKKDRTLTLYLTGKIDLNNNEAVKNEILQNWHKSLCSELILDFSDITYIASSGLRVIMQLSKDIRQGIKIVNVSQEVYDVFDVTGFTQIIPINKKKENVSTENLEMIGSDSTSVSYRIDEDKFIKDFSEFVPLELIKKERSNAQEAFINGINTTIPFNVVQTDYNYGIIYELMDYETIMDALKKNPNRLNELSQQFGKFMKETHSNEFENNTNFPSRKFHLIKFLNKYQEEIDSGKFYQLITLINSIPERNQFSHGNFQFSNVLLAEDTMFLIDMMHSGVGHPIFDIGSLYNSTILTNELLRKYPYARKMFISLGKNTNAEFFDKALKAYLNTDDEKKIDQVKKLAAIVGPLQFYEYYQTVFNTAFKNPLTKLLYNSILKFTKKKMIDGLKNIEKEEIDFNF